ncbi:MAG: hypothetical protein AAF718_17360 [Pseudomonadota bacterium]
MSKIVFVLPLTRDQFCQLTEIAEFAGDELQDTLGHLIAKGHDELQRNIAQALQELEAYRNEVPIDEG